jgi:hypothetical protein
MWNVKGQNCLRADYGVGLKQGARLPDEPQGGEGATIWAPTGVQSVHFPAFHGTEAENLFRVNSGCGEGLVNAVLVHENERSVGKDTGHLLFSPQIGVVDFRPVLGEVFRLAYHRSQALGERRCEIHLITECAYSFGVFERICG